MAVALLGVAFFMGTQRNASLAYIGQGVLLLLAVSAGVAAVFCLFSPLYSDNSGALIIAVVPLVLLGFIPWSLFRLARDIIRAKNMTPEEMEQFARDSKEMKPMDAALKLIEKHSKDDKGASE